MGEHADRFRAELATVYEAAGRPTLQKLVHLGQNQSPPISIADSTISGWLTGPAVPGEAHTRYFLALVTFLQAKAKASGGGYTERKPAWWQQLLLHARQDRNASRGRPRTGSGTTAPPGGPVTLPPAPAGFTGRAAELEKVLGWLEPGDGRAGEAAAVVVSAVAGMGGVGKTALALQAAHQAHARGWFPGGILFADLRGYGHDPIGAGETADRFLRTLGVKAKDLPDTVERKVDAWRVMLDALAVQGRPLLAVLDNVRNPGQIAALLPGPPHRALVTSRHTLSVLPAQRVDLNPLTPDDAVDLLDRTLRAGSEDDGRATAQPADALRLVELCGYLPLALRIIGALLRDEPDRPLAAQAAELEDERTRLDAMEYEADDDEGRPLAVRASFELSYRHLTGPQLRTFRLLAAAPGTDISTTAAAALLGQTPLQTRRLLAGLARAHLLNGATASAGMRPAGQGDRWAMHDLIRLFADALAPAHSDEDGRDTAVVRLLDHYLATAEAASTYMETRAGLPRSDLFTGRDQALQWLEMERLNLVAAAAAPPARRHPAGTNLFFALGQFLSWQRHFDDWISLTAEAVGVCRETGDRHREGMALTSLGAALHAVRRFDEAINAHTEAVALYIETRDLHSQAIALDNLGTVLTEVRRFDEAINAHTVAALMWRRTGNLHHEGMALNNLGLALQQVRRFDEAISAHTVAAAVFRETDDRHQEGGALTNLGTVLTEVRRLDEAISAHTDAAAIFRETGNLHHEGKTLNNLGLALQEMRRFDEAINAHTDAAAFLREVGDRHNEGKALNNLGAALAEVRRFGACQ
ncbi:tetratricopeptide repeat protein [Streptomyces sp. NPDC058086]|uniref:tetratricopeptide repeat protein n=1 Tax=Streptomyces sp. NPDC058086 TaxID=3346334 RepID=UPI0036E9A63B